LWGITIYQDSTRSASMQTPPDNPLIEVHHLKRLRVGTPHLVIVELPFLACFYPFRAVIIRELGERLLLSPFHVLPPLNRGAFPLLSRTLRYCPIPIIEENRSLKILTAPIQCATRPRLSFRYILRRLDLFMLFINKEIEKTKKIG